MDTLPFTLDDPDAMITETEGLAQLYDDELRLQLETKDAFLGKWVRHKEVYIPLEDIASVAFDAGWFSTKMTLQFRDLTSVHEVPGVKLGRLRLKFKKKHRDPAGHLAELITERIAPDDTPLPWTEP